MGYRSKFRRKVGAIPPRVRGSNPRRAAATIAALEGVGLVLDGSGSYLGVTTRSISGRLITAGYFLGTCSYRQIARRSHLVSVRLRVDAPNRRSAYGINASSVVAFEVANSRPLKAVSASRD